MKSRWERATPMLQWVGVPLAVFAFCFFVLGPHFSGSQRGSGSASAGSQPSVKANEEPIKPGKRKWIPVSPPQVSVTVTRTQVVGDAPTQTGLGTDPPLDQSPPDGTTVDEGSSSGAMTPPTKRTDKSGGTDPKKPDDKGSGDTFKGIGH